MFLNNNGDLIVEIKHYATREEAVEALSGMRLSSQDNAVVHKLVKSKYQGYTIMSIEAELYTDMLVGDVPGPSIINPIMPKYAD